MIGLLFVLFCACKASPPAPAHPEVDARYSSINTIEASARCRGPKGDYRTRVISHLDGSGSFSQVYTYKPEPFFVRLTREAGYVTNARDSILDTLPPRAAEAIRFHQFHKLQIDPSHFFTELSFVQSPQKENSIYQAKDRLGHHASLEFDRSRNVLLKVNIPNPMDTTEQIDIRYQQWLETNYGMLARELEIVQAARDTYYFSFDTLVINGSTVIPTAAR